MLQRVEIPSSVDRRVIPAAAVAWIAEAEGRIERFQDRWDRPQIEQFVAADFAHVYQTLDWTLQTQMTIGKRFLEWGCGFAVVSALASQLGCHAVGIEAEAELLDQARETIAHWQVDVELLHGNFLPSGASDLAEDPTVPSVGHRVGSAYRQLGLEVDDFAIIYSYPWPGEDDFHEAVFDRYAARGALLMMFCGPNDIRLWRKTTAERRR